MAPGGWFVASPVSLVSILAKPALNGLSWPSRGYVVASVGQPVAGGCGPSLVGQSITQHFGSTSEPGLCLGSREVRGISQHRSTPFPGADLRADPEFGVGQVDKRCPHGIWLQGTCEHGTARWLRLPCKRRGCEVCGAERRKRIAWRIANGIDHFGSCAWFVGTFARDIGKGEAVKVQAKFIRWLRGYLGYVVEYAATWETTKRGRLHVNIVFGPWKYVPQGLLSEKWYRFGGGRVVWIERVGGGVGQELAKSKWKVANYFAKNEQMVTDGHAACYSEGWPKLIEPQKVERKGDIHWQYRDPLGPDVTLFEYERNLRLWREVYLGEYAFAAGEGCCCFQYARSPSDGLVMTSEIINRREGHRQWT